MPMEVNAISYTSQNNDKVRASEVGVIGGATVGGAKYGISTFKKLKSVKAKDLINLSTKTTEQVQQVANASKGLKALWSKIGINAQKYSKAILEWAKKSATGKLAGSVVKSKVFGKISTVLGGIGAVFVFISGLGEMGNTFSKMSQKPNYLEA